MECAGRRIILQRYGIGGDKFSASQRIGPRCGIPDNLDRTEPGWIDRSPARVGIGRDIVDDLTVSPRECRSSDDNGIWCARTCTGKDRGR
jgi:hypothetical protein